MNIKENKARSTLRHIRQHIDKHWDNDIRCEKYRRWVSSIVLQYIADSVRTKRETRRESVLNVYYM